MMAISAEWIQRLNCFCGGDAGYAHSNDHIAGHCLCPCMNNSVFSNRRTPRGQRRTHSPQVRQYESSICFPNQACRRTSMPIGQLKVHIPHWTQRLGFRDNMAGCQCFMALESTAKEFLYTHKMGNVTLISRIRQVPQWSLGRKHRPKNTIYGDHSRFLALHMVFNGLAINFLTFPLGAKK